MGALSLNDLAVDRTLYTTNQPTIKLISNTHTHTHYLKTIHTYTLPEHHIQTYTLHANHTHTTNTHTHTHTHYLYTDEGAAVVGGGQQILDDGTHHPECILFLQKQQQRTRNLCNKQGQQRVNMNRVSKGLM